MSPTRSGHNHSKKSLAIDIRQTRGRELVACGRRGHGQCRPSRWLATRKKDANSTGTEGTYSSSGGNVTPWLVWEHLAKRPRRPILRREVD
jgi:hypothetical protein